MQVEVGEKLGCKRIFFSNTKWLTGNLMKPGFWQENYRRQLVTVLGQRISVDDHEMFAYPYTNEDLTITTKNSF
jgi:hypothetical protein